MTDQPIDDQYEDGEDPNEPSWRQKLRAEAKAGREAAARAEAAEKVAREAQRELAMRRAGVNVDSPLGAMFAKAWDGEIDVDAMKASWAEVSGNVAQPGVPQADQAALQRISAAAGGGTPVAGAPIDFETELDSIPMYVDSPTGKVQNPDYVRQVLAKTAEQAAREGRQFSTDGRGAVKWDRGGPTTPATTPLQG